MTVYLASRYSRREELLEYAELLCSINHTVTSRWLQGTHELEGKQDYTSEFQQSERERFALEDWEDLKAADLVISFTEPPRSEHSRGGRHVEFGGALMAGKRVIVVGYRENVFHCLPCVEFYPIWEECFAALCAEIEFTTE